MFNKNLIGFYQDKEFLPDDFDEFNSQIRLRQMFLNLSNNIFKDYCNFSRYEQKKLSLFSLKEAFSYKINKMLPISFIRKSSSTNNSFVFCLHSTKIINNYLHQRKDSIFSTSYKNLLPLAKLISICYSNNKMQVFIDKNLLFHEFVLNKIKRLHRNKTVIDLGDSICIKSKEIYGIKIYTSWRHIEIEKPDIKKELDNAIKSVKKGEYFQIYLAYPKNDKFKKHIPIYVNELKNKEYQIKAIPYSLRSIIKNNI